MAPSEAVAAEDVRVEAASSVQGERALTARRARAVEPYAPEPAPSAFPKVAAMIAALVLAVGLGWWLGGARLPWAVPGGSGSGVGAGSDVGPGTDGEPTSAEPSSGVLPSADARGTWCYTLVEEALSWEDAEAACEEAGGSLAQLRSQSQVDAVLAALEDADVQVVWLGARRDEEAASGFAWLDGAPVDAELFAPGEPNDEDGREDRLALLRVGGVWAVYDVPADLAGEYPAALVGYLRETAE